MNTSDKILKLSSFWYEYVSQDHHKDSDCHWYITQVYSYGEEPYWEVQHYGYVSDVEDENRYKTYKEANRALLALIWRAISKQYEWAIEVLSEKYDWDKWQIETAEFIYDFVNKKSRELEE